MVRLYRQLGLQGLSLLSVSFADIGLDPNLSVHDDSNIRAIKQHIRCIYPGWSILSTHDKSHKWVTFTKI